MCVCVNSVVVVVVYVCVCAGWIAALEYIAQDLGGAPAGAPLTRGDLERGYAAIAALEGPLAVALVRGLAAIPRVTVYGSTDPAARVGTVAFRVDGWPPAAVAARLWDDHAVAVGDGHFYATLPIEALSLMPDGVVRASLVHYTSHEDVARLLAGVAAIARVEVAPPSSA